jgi:hypothetical protein
MSKCCKYQYDDGCMRSSNIPFNVSADLRWYGFKGMEFALTNVIDIP